jgi:radical SAM superfamily enzyme YgiQ (UPF0313 family)
MPNWEDYDELNEATFIAIGCYVWGEHQSTSLMKWLRKNKPNCQIIAGGYQISDSEIENKFQYPEVDYFIHGAGEYALYLLLTSNCTKKQLNNQQMPESSFAQVYANNTIKLSKPNLHVRMETKRNCPFNCSFCSYQTGKGRKINYCELNLLNDELKAIIGSNPAKINITDPVFNIGDTYMPFLEAFKSLNSEARLNIQVRPELVQKMSNENRNPFLELCQELEVEIEFGLQTIQEEEMKIIGRDNNMKEVMKTLNEMSKANMKYGISLIYGLPGQTPKSFKNTIEFLEQYCSGQLVAYPLMLLQGTKLYREKDSYSLKQESLGDYNLKYVSESFSFNRTEYMEMEQMAKALNPNYRLF